jgi:Abnormal spindle-like microcephaly-assoc'd, ASPM-SPD-2-Hydin
MAKQRSGRGSCRLSNLQPNRRLDAGKMSKCLVAVVLAASLIGNGCAGVVMGSNPSGNGSTKSSGAGGAPPTGTAAPGNAPQPQLSATPMSASFPMVTTGTSSSQTITLQNGGNAAVTISAANVIGVGFGTSGLVLPMTIAAGQRAIFNIVFTPNVAGNATGSISLISDAANSPVVISTSGTGLAATALLSPSTSSLDFGSVLVGSILSLGVTLTNAGNANVTISSVVETGSGFTVSGSGASTVLIPGQTAALNITFAPSSLGAASGSILISSSAGALSISLSGSGGQLSSHTVALNWDPSTSTVVGYYVYRLLPDGTYGKVNTAPVPLTLYTDANIQSGQTYTYVVTAVDSNNVESDYSDPVLAVVP